MVTVRWMRLPGRRAEGSPEGRGAATPELDAWIETLHRLAGGRRAERLLLSRAGDETRARLRHPR